MQVRRICRHSIAQKLSPSYVIELNNILSNWKNSPEARARAPACDWGIGIPPSWHFCVISWSKNGSFSTP